MTKTMQTAYAEVGEILRYLPRADVEKIPQRLRNLFVQCRSSNVAISINPNRSITEQKVTYETLVILTILQMNYWCETEEEKAKLKQQLINNSNNRQEFNYIFQPSQAKEEENVFSKETMEKGRNLPIKAEKTPWFMRLWEKIKRLWKK